MLSPLRGWRGWRNNNENGTKTLLKDLIDIPEHLDTGQFVLKLTEGVTEPERTVAQYVVTDDLVKSFDDALGFIGGAILENKSRASYLHGSFGSGKSHFMAILHLILNGDPTARGIPKLAHSIQKSNKWASGKRFLLVPLYMIGASSSETGILGGYVDYMRRHLPDAPPPGAYRADAFFRDAAALRAKIGDDAFFAGLNENLASDGGWGDLDSTWDAARFEQALATEHGDEERSLLTGALIKSFYSSYAAQAATKAEEFIGLGKGLAAISQHAKSLGYDGVILFLDELILWLAMRSADLDFVQQECSKLVKLVETEDAPRPIPIISFVARQRDLRDLIGDSVPGAYKMNFQDLLKWWEGRFHEIKLEDRNLPAIANQRVLKCKSPSARAELDAEFDRFYGKIKKNDRDSLQTSDYDASMFKLVYPFSPHLGLTPQALCCRRFAADKPPLRGSGKLASRLETALRGSGNIMTNFQLLHPALQHHVVNSLGWRELRPFQESVIPLILDGQHLIVLAPTAGGKTEAAFFPVVSRMLSEGWSGLSVLYICPIKALLNNLDVRLQRYCTLLGRKSALWHGDIKQAARKRMLREPPDCLLTTPESLEVMLVSQNVDARALFSNLQVVIIDEIHAFAGDDRGWHLLAVLERISRLAGRELQRVGLSATVGNPKRLIDWIAGSCQGRRGVYLPPESGPGEADVMLDYVGSLENAAVVISRLHRGEKRLLFVDSRARAEQLATELRSLDVTTFVTHSSLSQEQRQQAEEAFATRNNCVIVATSVLELGVDVGDLDRVIQIDSPPTVSSFLQRMGRTGRRSGMLRNCLFLATKDETLVPAAGLIDLWAQGYVEPAEPRRSLCTCSPSS